MSYYNSPCKFLPTEKDDHKTLQVQVVYLKSDPVIKWNGNDKVGKWDWEEEVATIERFTKLLTIKLSN